MQLLWKNYAAIKLLCKDQSTIESEYQQKWYTLACNYRRNTTWNENMRDSSIYLPPFSKSRQFNLVSSVQFSSIQFSSVQFSWVQFSWVEFSSVQVSWVQFNSVEFSSIQLSSIQYSWVQFSSIQLSSIQLSSVQFSAVPFSSVHFRFCLARAETIRVNSIEGLKLHWMVSCSV